MSEKMFLIEFNPNNDGANIRLTLPSNDPKENGKYILDNRHVFRERDDEQFVKKLGYDRPIRIALLQKDSIWVYPESLHINKNMIDSEVSYCDTINEIASTFAHNIGSHIIDRTGCDGDETASFGFKFTVDDCLFQYSGYNKRNGNTKCNIVSKTKNYDLDSRPRYCPKKILQYLYSNPQKVSESLSTPRDKASSTKFVICGENDLKPAYTHIYIGPRSRY